MASDDRFLSHCIRLSITSSHICVLDVKTGIVSERMITCMFRYSAPPADLTYLLVRVSPIINPHNKHQSQNGRTSHHASPLCIPCALARAPPPPTLLSIATPPTHPPALPLTRTITLNNTIHRVTHPIINTVLIYALAILRSHHCRRALPPPPRSRAVRAIRSRPAYICHSSGPI